MVRALSLGPKSARAEAPSRQLGLGLELAGVPCWQPSLEFGPRSGRGGGRRRMVGALNLGPKSAGAEALSRQLSLGLELAGAPRWQPSLELELARALSLGPESARAGTLRQRMAGALSLGPKLAGAGVPSRQLSLELESAGAPSRRPSLGRELARAPSLGPKPVRAGTPNLELRPTGAPSLESGLGASLGPELSLDQPTSRPSRGARSTPRHRPVRGLGSGTTSTEEASPRPRPVKGAEPNQARSRVRQ